MIGKFKVWDGQLKSFLSGEFYFLDSSGKLHYLFNSTSELHTIYTSVCHDWIVPIFSTGKTDKNGVELFDGDIVKASIYEGEGEAVLVIQCRKNVFVIDYDDGDIDCFLVVDFPGIIEKIGNKFENPELMEPK